MKCLLCNENTQSLRRNKACCRDCRNDFDVYREKYKSSMVDILTGKMSVADFEERYPGDISNTVEEEGPESSSEPDLAETYT